MSIGEKMLGWFIVEEDGNEAARAAVPAPKAAPPPKLAPIAPVVTSGSDDQLLGRVLTLLESLPANAPADMKRTMVAASLAAFGVRIDAVVASGQAALVALERHGAAAREKHEATLASTTDRIAKLEAEIAAGRQIIAAERARNLEATAGLESEKARLRSVLSFFEAR